MNFLEICKRKKKNLSPRYSGTWISSESSLYKWFFVIVLCNFVFRERLEFPMGLLEENKYDWPKIPPFDPFLLLVHQGTFKQNSPWHLQSKTFQTPYICSEHPSFSYEAAWVAASSPQTLEHDPSRGITPSTLGEYLGLVFQTCDL